MTQTGLLLPRPAPVLIGLDYDRARDSSWNGVPRVFSPGRPTRRRMVWLAPPVHAGSIGEDTRVTFIANYLNQPAIVLEQIRFIPLPGW